MNSPGPLTDDEHTAVRLAGELSAFITKRVIAGGPAQEQDVAELEAAVHVIQRMVLSQAAARFYPDTYRLLGTTIEQERSRTLGL